ncbi:arylsulfatase A-like enzyme [Ereboglobus sp. PH5-5]|uniref:sulfatase n=1 Tax=Ereboglobus sp. PH5-5 TaxID=2940529 RepID=UPI002407749A|nr:sulfatase [Ereboglobus sp. PH5-5]MDF9834372.1 arylsulfatase A-like enzyme [Ereboglobus sp. PH5-5]
MKTKISAAAAGLLACAAPVFSADATRPNIVFILVDDLGISDIGAFGASFYETPNIDKLIARGMRFTNAYTPVAICAPARASAMTGKHPLKLGMWNHYHHMPDNSVTVASRLKDAGYATWHVGKWHCGSPANKTLPHDVGFDVNIAGWEAWAPASYFWPYKKNRNRPIEKVPTRSRVPGLEEGGREGEYLTDRLTDEALRLIDRHDTRAPFFLNLWHFAVHTPLQAKPEKIEKYRQKAKRLAGMNEEYFYDAKGTRYFENPNMDERCATYAAMIESVDESVGRVVAALKKKGVYENTLIIFYSDNGPLTDRLIKTPYRGGKNSTYQGGIRMPASLTWEAKIKPGAENHSEINIYDLPHTMLAAAGTAFPANHGGDGLSLLPLALGAQEKLPARTFVWYFPSTRMHWGQYASAAMKDEDNWKYQMLFNGEGDELYNLNIDPRESNNLIKKHPEKAAQMEKKLRDELNRYYAGMPKPDEIYIENVERRLRGEPAARVQDKNY